MSKYAHGEYLPIVWDGCREEPKYIRGHVSEAEASTALAEWIGDHEIAEIRHTYARFTRAEGGRDWEMDFTVGWGRSRGSFAVTEVKLAGKTYA